MLCIQGYKILVKFVLFAKIRNVFWSFLTNNTNFLYFVCVFFFIYRLRFFFITWKSILRAQNVVLMMMKKKEKEKKNRKYITQSQAYPNTLTNLCCFVFEDFSFEISWRISFPYVFVAVVVVVTEEMEKKNNINIIADKC